MDTRFYKIDINGSDIQGITISRFPGYANRFHVLGDKTEIVFDRKTINSKLLLIESNSQEVRNRLDVPHGEKSIVSLSYDKEWTAASIRADRQDDIIVYLPNVERFDMVRVH